MRRTRYAGAWVERVVAMRGDVSRQRYDTPDTDSGLSLVEVLVVVVLVVILGLAFGLIHT